MAAASMTGAADDGIEVVVVVVVVVVVGVPASKTGASRCSPHANKHAMHMIALQSGKHVGLRCRCFFRSSPGGQEFKRARC